MIMVADAKDNYKSVWVIDLPSGDPISYRWIKGKFYSHYNESAFLIKFKHELIES